MTEYVVTQEVKDNLRSSGFGSPFIKKLLTYMEVNNGIGYFNVKGGIFVTQITENEITDIMFCSKNNKDGFLPQSLSFTDHCLERCLERNINPVDVLEAIKYGTVEKVYKSAKTLITSIKFYKGFRKICVVIDVINHKIVTTYQIYSIRERETMDVIRAFDEIVERVEALPPKSKRYMIRRVFRAMREARKHDICRRSNGNSQ